MKLRSIVIALLFSMLCGLSVSASAADKINKQTLVDCLASSHNKYTLYHACIGKFVSACAANYDVYADELKDISVGPPIRNCMERESIWWNELFKHYSQELIQASRQRTTDAGIQETLAATLSDMKKRTDRECGYVSVRWGYRQGGQLQIQGLDDQFKCMRDISAENAITVYLWNEAAR